MSFEGCLLRHLDRVFIPSPPHRISRLALSSILSGGAKPIDTLIL